MRSAECALFSEIEFPLPLLDIGCGDGTFGAVAFARPVDVGIDNSRPQLRRAKKLHAYATLAAAQADVLPFRDGAFGSVISNSTLEHIQAAPRAIAEAARVLRPGGVFVATMPDERFLRYLAGSRALRALRLSAAARGYEWFFNRISRHAHIGPAEMWLSWTKHSGLEIEAWRYYYARRDMVAFEAAHYLSVPSLVTRAALGRWVLWPGKSRLLPFGRLLAPFATPGPAGDGAYILIHARKP